jgi:AcrR family transcriptional regulator
MPKDSAVTNPRGKAFSTRRRDPETKREAILETAAQLFLEKSYGRTLLNDVAQRLKITKPALYHYFRNKEEILVECYRLGTDMIGESLGQIAAQYGTGLQKVQAFIYSYANVMTVNFGRCVMRLDEGDLSSAARAEVRARKKRIDQRLRSFIQEGIADGSITPCDPKLAAFSIAGAVNWICMWYRPNGLLSPEEIATQFARTLTQGLAREKNVASCLGPATVPTAPSRPRPVKPLPSRDREGAVGQSGHVIPPQALGARSSLQSARSRDRKGVAS